MKYILSLFLLSTFALSSEINWITTYEEAQKIASKLNKPMLLFMNRKGCGSCQYMKENVFTDEGIIDFIDKKYVAVSLVIKKNDAPKLYKTNKTPVFHFVNADGKKIYPTLFGGKTAPFFLKLLKKTLYKDSK